jgi:UDP-hydrolysing UDP-N-acetyl-D-glucosamine 2-epimerase
MKKICFVTLSRSDYASLRPLIIAAQNDPYFEMSTVSGGSHMLKRYGKTIDGILSDGVRVQKIIPFLLETDDSKVDLAKAYARAVTEFTAYFSKNRPEIVFILGDRWEMLAVASAASMLWIPIAHHSGGDLTQGSADNQTRYALSCLSHLHFTAHEQHKERLIVMGEEPWRVFVSGEPALQAVYEPSDDIGLGFPQDKPFALGTYHPSSYESLTLEQQIGVFIKALEMIEGHQIILTAPNPDGESGIILESLESFAKSRPDVHLIKSMGTKAYYAAMRKAAFMIGNSSSGIWEAPSFGLPVVNIGRRQEDRLRAANVIDVGYDLDAIRTAIKKAISIEFKATLKGLKNPYVHENTVSLILDALKEFSNAEILLAKKIVDPLRISRSGS